MKEYGLETLWVAGRREREEGGREGGRGRGERGSGKGDDGGERGKGRRRVSESLPFLMNLPLLAHVHYTTHTCGKVTALGVLCYFVCLFVCLTLLASFSFSSLINMHIYYTCFNQKREGRKKEASKVKQTTRQSDTAHPRLNTY